MDGTRMNAIELYETMSTLSGQMAEAARAGDWDKLVALEAKCAGLARQLEASEPSTPVPLEHRDRKVALIHRILADDAEVRRHTEPWMAQIKPFLGAGVRGRELRRAYGAPGAMSGQ